MYREIKFQSQRFKCAGWLFIPENLSEAQKAPAIVMAHGLGAVKEQGLKPFAKEFCQAGFVTLVFDYRHFGDSEGEPRCQHFPLEMAEDYKNAVTWISMHPKVDSERIGIWGTSYSGGLAVHVGTVDPRIKAVVSQVPSAITPTDRQAMNPEKWSQVGELLAKDRLERYTTGKLNYLKVVASEGMPCVLPGEESYCHYTKYGDQAPNFQNQITLESLEKMREFNPVDSIQMMAPTALLMLPAENDSLLPFEAVKGAFDRAGGPKKIIPMSIGHYDIYENPWRAKAIEKSVAWYVRYL
jgi:fermentation-respiration switch protein FrsA (DUF1100 family)